MSTKTKAERIKEARKRRLKRHIAYAAIPIGIAIGIIIVSLIVIAPTYNNYKKLINATNSTADSTALIESYEGTPGPSSGKIFNSSVQIPVINEKFGTLKCKDLDINADLYFGDNEAVLAAGVGQHTGSHLPGYGSTILVAGHSTTYFAGLESCKEGDVFTLETSYGTFQYRVADIEHKLIYNEENDENLSVVDFNSSSEVLILYTCYPFEVMAPSSNERLFVSCEKISGPEVVGLEASGN